MDSASPAACCKYLCLLFALISAALAGPTRLDSRGSLDSLGGGHVLRQLDPLGGGHVLRALDPLGGGHVLRGLDSLGGGHILREAPAEVRYQQVKRGLDPLSGMAFGVAKKNFDEIDRAGFGGFVKKNFDEIDRSGFGRFVKKNGFDEIDRAGFGSFVKKWN